MWGGAMASASSSSSSGRLATSVSVTDHTAIGATEHVPQGATEHVPMYAETEVELMQSTMLVPWDDIESPVRVMLNNGIDVNRVGVWQLYAEFAFGVMVVCFGRWRAHLGAGEHELC